MVGGETDISLTGRVIKSLIFVHGLCLQAQSDRSLTDYDHPEERLSIHWP